LRAMAARDFLRFDIRLAATIEFGAVGRLQ
jgi:hypothetical protein